MEKDKVFIYCEHQFSEWTFEHYLTVLKLIVEIPSFLLDNLFVENGGIFPSSEKGKIDSGMARMSFEEALRTKGGIFLNEENSRGEGGFIESEKPIWSFRSKAFENLECIYLAQQSLAKLGSSLDKIHFAYWIISSGSERCRRSHFPYQTIVPHSGILSWLHYFSPAAIVQYKLERLFDNPYLKVSAVGEGHLFEVLENPFEINTPEGEAKVIAANKWMLEH
jgi:hypothetical protein